MESIAPDMGGRPQAVCNLASIALRSFIRENKYDFQRLHDTNVVAFNLNHVIDINITLSQSAPFEYAPSPYQSRCSGSCRYIHGPTHALDSPEARLLNQQIFETIYHAAWKPAVRWHRCKARTKPTKAALHLREEVAERGLRNSLLVAPMPTASTSQISSFNECFEPYTSNIYTRRVLAGEFQVVTIAKNDPIQSIPEIPADVKVICKTVWEISQKKAPTVGQLTSTHFYGWKRGLKTGMYYIRTRPAAQAIQSTPDHSLVAHVKQQKE
ncbi:hypothetical protein BJV78DRAFT_1359244 [Lactifluus subvellereus]|nr:hypothetical protein BJV78DRAFT_1359244 [Lactifluus subvellereus]